MTLVNVKVTHKNSTPVKYLTVKYQKVQVKVNDMCIQCIVWVG